MLSILLGLFGLVVGFLMVWKSEKFLAAIGEQAWMEKFFGPGHGTTGYQTIGIIIILLSLMLMTGMVESFLTSIFIPNKR